MGSYQGEIETFEAGQREAYHESRGTRENCGCATKEMGAGEGEDGRLNDDEADDGSPAARPYHAADRKIDSSAQDKWRQIHSAAV